MLDVRTALANTLKGVEVKKGTPYQGKTGREPDKVVRVEYSAPKVVHHIGRNANYKYVL